MSFREMLCWVHGKTMYKMGFCLKCMEQYHLEEAEEKVSHALEYRRRYCDNCGEVRTFNRSGCMICIARKSDPKFAELMEQVQADVLARKAEEIRTNDSFCCLEPEE